jgi:hypothetical protein
VGNHLTTSIPPSKPGRRRVMCEYDRWYVTTTRRILSVSQYQDGLKPNLKRWTNWIDIPLAPTSSSSTTTTTNYPFCYFSIAPMRISSKLGTTAFRRIRHVVSAGQASLLHDLPPLSEIAVHRHSARTLRLVRCRDAALCRCSTLLSLTTIRIALRRI